MPPPQPSVILCRTSGTAHIHNANILVLDCQTNFPTPSPLPHQNGCILLCNRVHWYKILPFCDLFVQPAYNVPSRPCIESQTTVLIDDSSEVRAVGVVQKILFPTVVVLSSYGATSIWVANFILTLPRARKTNSEQV